MAKYARQLNDNDSYSNENIYSYINKNELEKKLSDNSIPLEGREIISIINNDEKRHNYKKSTMASILVDLDINYLQEFSNINNLDIHNDLFSVYLYKKINSPSIIEHDYLDFAISSKIKIDSLDHIFMENITKNTFSECFNYKKYPTYDCDYNANND